MFQGRWCGGEAPLFLPLGQDNGTERHGMILAGRWCRDGSYSAQGGAALRGCTIEPSRCQAIWAARRAIAAGGRAGWRARVSLVWCELAGAHTVISTGRTDPGRSIRSVRAVDFNWWGPP